MSSLGNGYVRILGFFEITQHYEFTSKNLWIEVYRSIWTDTKILSLCTDTLLFLDKY